MRKEIINIALLCLAVNTVKAKSNPNVIIIMTDEHNFRTLGCYRNLLSTNQAFPWGEDCFVETPNIDFLANNGTLCLNCYATNPVSGPSRSSFMTGLYPQSTGVDKNNKSLNKNIATFADVLSHNGYTTGYFGKWHLSGGSKPGWTPSEKHGWKNNLYMYNRGHWKKLGNINGKPEVQSFNSKGKLSESDLSGADEITYTTDFLTDRAIEFIDENKDKSFCCFISIPDPHGHNIVRSPYDTMYSDMQFEKPNTAFNDTSNMPSWAEKSPKTILDKNEMDKYFGMVKCIDDNVGKLINYLLDKKLSENTIIVFTADHGDLLGEHGRDNKSVPYEASAKIPYIWYYPQKIVSGNVVNTAMNNADFLPTLMGFLGVDKYKKCHGKDFSSLIAGKVQKVYNVTFSKNLEWIMATDGNHKLVLTRKLGAKPVLFDLKKDPDEEVNEFNNVSYASVKKKLADALKDYCISTDEPLWNDHKIHSEIIEIINN